VQDFSLFEFVVDPISLEEDSSLNAAAAVQVGRCLPGALTSLIPFHLFLLALIENVAAAVYSEEKGTVALTAGCVGNCEDQAVENADDLTIVGC
jgi:hypothetical protein